MREFFIYDVVGNLTMRRNCRAQLIYCAAVCSRLSNFMSYALTAICSLLKFTSAFINQSTIL